MAGIVDFRIRPPQRDNDSDPMVSAPAGMVRYQELYDFESRINLPFTELESELERFEVRGVVQAEFEDSGRSRFWNQRVAELIGRRPDLFLGGIASVDPNEEGALEELEWAHGELGLQGLVIQPAFLGLRATDDRIYPLYDYCARNNLIVTVHTGVNFSAYGSMDLGRPLHIDRVACDFPGLPLVCNHGGWPWVVEALALAWRHPQVFLEFGAVAPKYLCDPNSGWRPVVHWMRRQLREQVLFATDWPMLSYERVLAELPLLELDAKAEEAYCSGNALKLISNIWDKNGVA